LLKGEIFDYVVTLFGEIAEKTGLKGPYGPRVGETIPEGEKKCAETHRGK